MAEMSEDTASTTNTPEPQHQFPLNIKIKTEKVTPPPSPTKNADAALILSSIDNILDTALSAIKNEKDEKATIEPVKSSNEILAELFQVFNSVPPDPLTASQLVDSTSSKKKKKHKKHKKKHRKKGRSSSDDDEDSSGNDGPKTEQSSAEKIHKHKKVKKEKKRKRDESPPKSDEKRKVKREKPNTTTIKTESASARPSHKRKRPTEKSPKDATDLDMDIVEYEQKLLEETMKKPSSSSLTTKSLSAGQRSSKIVIKDLRNSAVYEETVNQVKAKERAKQKSDTAHEEEELPRSGLSRSSSISLSDEETYLKNKYSSSRGFTRDAVSPSRYSGRNATSSRSYRDRERCYDRDNRRPYDVHQRGNSGRSSYLRRRSRTRSRSRRRDNSEDRIDKKRLLEIARKNAILMLKNGTLPGTQNLAPDAKEKVLAKMRYGGRSLNMEIR